MERYLNLAVKEEKHENLIWYCPYPMHESAAVAGMINFYQKDFVDISVDDVII